MSEVVDLETISAQLDGYSGDDITNICRDAAMNGMRRITHGKTPAELKKLREMGQVGGQCRLDRRWRLNVGPPAPRGCYGMPAEP